MFVKIPENGYWFKKDGIRKIEEKYGAMYMGYWCTKSPNGNWNESPVDVFYQPNPDTSLGHTNYFGMFIKTDPCTGKSTGSVYITEASSAFSDPIAGIPTDDGMIDGGRDYTRSSMHSTVKITVDGDKFVIAEPQESVFANTIDHC